MISSSGGITQSQLDTKQNILTSTSNIIQEQLVVQAILQHQL